MRRILVVVDGTQASREAARTALEYASGLGSRVTFVHVLPERVAEQAGEAPEFADFEQACEQYAEALLEETCSSTRNRPQVANTLVAHDSPRPCSASWRRRRTWSWSSSRESPKGALARTLLGSVSGEPMCRCPKPGARGPRAGSVHRVVRS